jgi:hypothetical protein
MGIDAEMFVRVKREVSDNEVRSLRRKLATSFGPERFWIFNNGGSGEAPLDEPDWDLGPVKRRHCLERVPSYTQDGDDIVPEPGETFLRVYIASRFYGDGYERGDLPTILAVARMLRDLTGGAVWYGGDSSGVCAVELTPKAEAELWALFCSDGGQRYYERDFGGGVTRPDCDFCAAPMTANGGGPDGWAAASCLSCGAVAETHNAGATWFPVLSNRRTQRAAYAADMLRMDLARMKARIAVFTQALAAAARAETTWSAAGRAEWAKETIRLADAAALNVRKEDLVKAEVQ